jgi:hypothetical protein
MSIHRTFLRHTLQATVLVSALALLGAFRTDPGDPGILETVVRKLREFHTRHPQEKLYMQFDKPFYVAGDSIWFKAYLVEASLHSLDSQSNVLYVELLNSGNAIIQRKVLYANGVSFGDFALPDTLREGNYLVRAYTNYMRNAGEDFFFKKEIPVLNPATAGTLQLPMANPDSIDLQFFPEGGELVAFGKFNRIAFKATGQNGRGAFVEGEILDDQLKKVATFKTEHDGMGLLWLNPEAGKSYHAKIIKPYPSNRSYSLPRVNEKGYVLQVNQAGKNITVIAFSNVSPEPVPAGIIVQCRGKVYHAQQATINPEGFFATLASDKFPEGINQLTVFDAAGRPVAERLIYIQHNESLSLKLAIDSNAFKKRGQVTVYADAAYPNGKPAFGNFSITVYDDDRVPDTGEYPLTISSYLSLTSDLKGHVESPGYYFKDAQPETRKNLDLLMLVQGWRRFTWKDVLENTDYAQPHRHERGIPLSGRVMKVIGKKALRGSTLKIMTMNGQVLVAKPDSLGKFYTDALLFYDSMDLVIQAENEKGKKQPNTFLLDPLLPAAPAYSPMTDFIPFVAPEYVKQQAQKNKIDKSLNAIMLREFTATAKRPDPVLESKMIGPVANAFKVGDLGKSYVNMLEILQSRIPGVRVDGNPPRMRIAMRGKTNIYILLDGQETTQEVIETIAPSNIELIEIFQGGTAGGRFSDKPTLNFVTRTKIMDREPIGITRIKYPGFYQAREFYAPRYDVPEPRHDVPDNRTTLFWEPLIETNSTGRAAVSFFTADVSSTYRIVMEGITPDGCAGSATVTFRVK